MMMRLRHHTGSLSIINDFNSDKPIIEILKRVNILSERNYIQNVDGVRRSHTFDSICIATTFFFINRSILLQNLSQ